MIKPSTISPEKKPIDIRSTADICLARSQKRKAPFGAFQKTMNRLLKSTASRPATSSSTRSTRSSISRTSNDCTRAIFRREGKSTACGRQGSCSQARCATGDKIGTNSNCRHHRRIAVIGDCSNNAIGDSLAFDQARVIRRFASIGLILWQRDSRQDADDCNDNHQFDQSETLLSFLHLNLLFGKGGKTAWLVQSAFVPAIQKIIIHLKSTV